MKLLLTISMSLLLTGCFNSDEGGDSSGGGLFQKNVSGNKFALDLPSNKTYSDGENIDFSLDHSQIISVSGSPRLRLNIGGEIKYADFLTGDDSRTIVFRYTVGSDDLDTDGIEVHTTIDLNSGSLSFTDQGVITDANLDFDERDSSGILVQTIVLGPATTNFLEPINGTYAENGSLLFQVDFEESVTVSGTPRLSLNLGGSTVYANYTGGSGSQAIEFTYTVQAGDEDLDGISLNSSAIDLNGGSIVSNVDGDDAQTSFASFVDSLAAVLVNTSLGIDAPDQVATLSTAPTTNNTTLAISWSVPNDNGTAIVDYSLQYREQGMLTWTNVSPSPTTNSANLSGLVEGTTYEFRVAANNGLLGPFSPVEEAEIFAISSLNPIAWLSATNITNGGTEPSHGDKIASWSDLSGVASAATESDPNNQPLYHTNVQNGLPAVRFDGLTRSLEGTFTRVNNSGLTVFLVAKMDQNNTRKCFFEFYSTTATRRGFFFNYGFNEASTNYNLDDTSFNVWTAYDDGSNTDLSENGSSVYTDITNWGPTDFTGAGAYVLGDDQTSGDQINGYIGEFLIFDKQLTAQEIEKIETYLKNKWGTP